jgi:superfamily II DNA or RNA helicase
MDLRPYQVDALQAFDAYWAADGGHPLAVLATATGKSVLIGKLIADITAQFPNLRALVLVHVRACASAIGPRQSCWPIFRAFGAIRSGSAVVI